MYLKGQLYFDLRVLNGSLSDRGVIFVLLTIYGHPCDFDILRVIENRTKLRLLNEAENRR